MIFFKDVSLYNNCPPRHAARKSRNEENKHKIHKIKTIIAKYAFYP